MTKRMTLKKSPADGFAARAFSAGQLMSGHALKHVIAALGPASRLYGRTRRHAGYGKP